MRLTVRQFSFMRLGCGVPALTSAVAWDSLRTGNVGPEYAIPEDREEWLELVARDRHAEARSGDIIQLLGSRRVSSILSMGVGRGAMEYWLKRRAPGTRLTCADFSPAAIERLAVTFTMCDRLLCADLRTLSIAERYDAIILNRVDQELTDAEWRDVFATLATSLVGCVVFVPCDVLTLRTLVLTQARRLVGFVRRQQLVFTGWLRTRQRFESLWAGRFQIAAELDSRGVPCLLLVPV